MLERRSGAMVRGPALDGWFAPWGTIPRRLDFSFFTLDRSREAYEEAAPEKKDVFE
ncbi:hypothetical protein SERLADRAFT_451137 [Serpula lacrymans var. lacrymans S7.9]|nr:uncharacterized protein SERLADRAFT_451137 [Serpula lacrymans var. lacrymans S7.9]EGO22268.1 hypothetical protein SERLADRAFT_451137 [Serpula lacrymans var. lacrymans S7.9]